MSDHHALFRLVVATAAYPVGAILLYGSARLIAMVLVRIIPDCKLKRRLFTDTDTGLLAYKPSVRRKGALKGGALGRRDS